MPKINVYDCLQNCLDQQSEISDAEKQCMSDCQPDKYTAPLIWVGFYIAGASLVCMIFMAADLFNGFRMKRSWFPCEHFTLNAAISALLAIALKMPVDLSSFMPCGRDQLMKLSATALMSVSMANFMPSLAAMSNQELFANLMALAFFIVPLITNVYIQIGTGIIYQGAAIQHVVILFCIIIQFALLVSTAIASPSMKKRLETAYNKEAISPITSTSFSDDDSTREPKPKMISAELKKQWIMAQTSSPQFVIARSVICTASGAICVLTVLVLAEAVIQLYITLTSKQSMFRFPSSDYDWSADVIVVVQAAAVLVGSISPICRWITAVWFKFEGYWTSEQRLKDLWSVEEYWTERLEELKNLSVELNPESVKFNIFIRSRQVKFLISIFIKFQRLTVVSCKLLCLVSLLFLLPFMYVYKTIIMTSISDVEISKWELKLDQKEPGLPKSTLKKIISLFYGNFNKGTKKAVPENQISLLKKSDGFDGIKEFDRNLIEELTKMTIDAAGGVSNYNPNGEWAIRIVTLSTIVCAIKTDWDNEFVSMVSNILPHVIYIEKALGASTATQTNNNNIDLGLAAINVWLDVLYSRKWRNTKLPIKTNTSLKMKIETLKELTSKKKDEESQVKKKDEESQVKKKDEESQVQDPAVEWMNKTVEIIIKFLDRAEKKIEGHQQVDEMNKIEEEQQVDIEMKKIEEQQVETMTRMVLDILVACLVNLEKAITVNISKASIEKRELVVKKATFISGETVEIQKLVNDRLSSIVESPDHQKYEHASWWKVVTLNIPLEDAIITTTVIPGTDEHRIDVQSKSIDDDDDNEHESNDTGYFKC